MSAPGDFKYRAFLSYSHRDQAWGKWLHAALESYRIDKDLSGRLTAAGPVPMTLRPIFRDREDFSAGHSLSQQTLAALEASQFLIVVCSPNAAQSKYVDEEVRRFKMLGRAERVIPLIVDGDPSDGERECFPPALRYKFGTDGKITAEREEPIAADARAQGDGKEIAKQKVVAGLLGLGLDEIMRRAERARRRRNQFWGTLAGVFLVLAVAASGSAVYAWQQLKTNEAFLNATLQRATEIIDEAVAQAENYNVPRAATLRLLAKAEGLFDDMAQYGRPTPELRYRKAWMLIQFARNYAILGDTGKQFERANEAYRLLAGLAAEEPGDKVYQRDLAIAYSEVGDVLLPEGKLDEALFAYRASLTIMERVNKADPGDVEWQRDLSVSYNRVGNVLVAQGHLEEALQAYRASFAIREGLANSDPGNAQWQHDLSVSYGKIGNVLVAQGHLEEALQAYRAALAISEQLAKADAGNSEWQRDISVGYEKVGEVLAAQGKLDEALKAHRNDLAIAERLAKADPSSALWQRDLSVSYEKVGDILLAQEQLDEALQAYRASLAIREGLAKADPGNTDRRRDLSVSYEKVGDVLTAQANLNEALQAYRYSLAIREGLAKADPANSQWQYDLSDCYIRFGDVLLAQDKLDEALQAYRDSLTIYERLTTTDPSNAGWQRELAISYGKLASVHVKLDDRAAALTELRTGREIIARLVTLAAGNAQWQKDLAWLNGEIARLEGQAQEAGRN